MLSVFIKEQKRYYKNELVKILKLKPDEIVGFIRKLKSFGVLKMVKATPEERELSELLDENDELINEEENTDKYFYVFTYVGILTIGNRVLKCYPKYVKDTELHEKMKQVLNVLRKYNSREQIVALFNGEEENTSFNLLAIMLYLLEEYAENGVYTNELLTIEDNGSGEILWDNTINETYAVIRNSRPVYVDLKTINIDDDEQDFFRRLHCCIVTKCSQILEQAGLDKLFDLGLVDVSEAEIDDFGDEEYILYRIQRELDIQFNDRKKMLLKTMYTYISHRKAFETGLGISMFGTNSFNLVWERVCANVFDNKLNVKLNELKQIPNSDYFDAERKTLIEVIEKPKWRYKETDNLVEQSKTLTPDLISIYPYKDSYCFAILDAKYYLIKLTKHSIEGNPGVGDVTKQYLYQLAYQDFIERCGFKYIQNAFLMPVDDEDGEFVGTAEFNMMRDAGKRLEHISVIKLPAEKLYQAYLNGRPDLSLFDFLKMAPIKQIGGDSFSKRMLAYLKAGMTLEADNSEGKIVSYPERMRSNVGAKVLFDIIAPEVAHHSYVYSPYKHVGIDAAAKDLDIIDIEEKIVQFIETLISKYVEAIQKNTMVLEECLLLVNNMVNEWDFQELKEQEKRIAETLQILYQ